MTYHLILSNIYFRRKIICDYFLIIKFIKRKVCITFLILFIGIEILGNDDNAY